jgi:hypothetical protein
MRFLKLIMRKRYFVYLLAAISSGAILLSSGLSTVTTSAQGTNSIYLTPASGGYAVGANFTVTVRVNTTDQVNAVTADMSYSSNLQYISIDGSGSAFGIDASSSGGGGSVSINRATITPVSGDQLVSRVTFKVLSAGTGTVSMNSSSQALSSTTNQNVVATRNGGSYTLQGGSSPSPSPTPTPTPAPTPSPTPGSTPTPTPSPSAKTSTNLPKTTIAAQGNPATTPLPGGSTVELAAPATLETTTDGTKEILKVEYILNGKVVSTDTTPPYAHNVNTVNLRNGTYSLTSKTYYKDGKVDSSKVSLVVKNPFGLTQLWLQLKHYAWLIVILLIVAGELFYLKFVRGKGSFKPKGRGSSSQGNATGHGSVVVGGSGASAVTPSASGAVVSPSQVPKV